MSRDPFAQRRSLQLHDAWQPCGRCIQRHCGPGPGRPLASRGKPVMDGRRSVQAFCRSTTFSISSSIFGTRMRWSAPCARWSRPFEVSTSRTPSRPTASTLRRACAGRCGFGFSTMTRIYDRETEGLLACSTSRSLLPIGEKTISDREASNIRAFNRR